MEGETVIMKLKYDLAEILVTTSPQLYRKYLIIENGKTVLYVELLKALYGTLKATLLFYKKLNSAIIDKGFKFNPYDSCVANKIINDKQFTLVWHFDDLKLSHEDGREVSKMITWFKSVFEEKEIGKIKVSIGNKHKFLGMNFNFNNYQEVQINMKNYIEDMIKTFPEVVTKGSATPAVLNLFKTRYTEKLNDKEASLFHTITAKGLFLCKRDRPYILTTIAYLTTRVKEPDIDNWKKLRKIIQYLYATKDLVLTLNNDKLNIIKWFVDASHGVHDDMKGKTGVTITLGKSSIYNKLTKQKISTIISTESELVGVDDMMPMVLWTNNFLKEQGFDTQDTIIYQDNKSTILLENNGRFSSGKRTRHIEATYFLSQTA